MKTILIIIVLHSTTAITAVEFDDAPACERAAAALHQLASVRTLCVAKFNPTDERTIAMADVEQRVSVQRLGRDLAIAASTLSDEEARFLVDAYYQMQEGRKRTANQARSMDAEPHSVLVWLREQDEILEGQIKRALEKYTDARPIGQWMKSHHGIGPVIAAGLLAHIDITKASTAGKIWRYAGLDPTSKWEKGNKRPWNAELKTLCWKIGQSFMKFSGDDACFYGHVYRERKAYEVARNEQW